MTSEGAYRDRGVRLRLFGLLTILAGIGAVLLGLSHFALPLLADSIPDFRITASQIATGVITFVAIGVVLVACGTGSIRERRWVRPAMLTVGWTWLFVGLATLGFVVTNLDDLTILAGSELADRPPEIETLIRWILLLPCAGFGIVMPLLILWAYNHKDVLATCRARHPDPDWSDRCPSTVLVLALALGFAGLLSLPMALRPLLPWFGDLRTGVAGSALTLLSGAGFVWIGWALFRLKPSAWWATGISTILVAASTVWTLLETPRAAWYRALDYPERQIELLLTSGEPPKWPGIVATLVLTFVTLVYLASIRKHFRKGVRSHVSTSSSRQPKPPK